MAKEKLLRLEPELAEAKRAKASLTAEMKEHKAMEKDLTER